MGSIPGPFAVAGGKECISSSKGEGNCLEQGFVGAGKSETNIAVRSCWVEEGVGRLYLDLTSGVEREGKEMWNKVSRRNEAL